MLSVQAVGATVSNACELQEFEGVRIQDVRGQGSKLEWETWKNLKVKHPSDLPSRSRQLLLMGLWSQWWLRS